MASSFHRDNRSAHGPQERRSVKHLTCFYWSRGGGCRFTAEQCAYAHLDTGRLAEKPARATPGGPILAGKSLEMELNRQRSLHGSSSSEVSNPTSQSVSPGSAGISIYTAQLASSPVITDKTALFIDIIGPPPSSLPKEAFTLRAHSKYTIGSTSNNRYASSPFGPIEKPKTKQSATFQPQGTNIRSTPAGQIGNQGVHNLRQCRYRYLSGYPPGLNISSSPHFSSTPTTYSNNTTSQSRKTSVANPLSPFNIPFHRNRFGVGTLSDNSPIASDVIKCKYCSPSSSLKKVVCIRLELVKTRAEVALCHRHLTEMSCIDQKTIQRQDHLTLQVMDALRDLDSLLQDLGIGI